MENYQKTNTRLGLPENTQTYRPEIFSGRAVTVLSSDPRQSDVPPMNIPVSSISHLNQLIGMPDDCDDSQIKYPPRLSELTGEKYMEIAQIRQFLYALTPEDRAYIKMAVEAYLMGNSEKVKEYEPLINAGGFPGKIAYFACSSDVEISGEVIFKGEDPVVWNCGRIVLLDRAKLTIQAAGIIFADKLECGGSENDPNEIAIYPPDFLHKAPKGIDGTTGAKGQSIGGKGGNANAGNNGQKGLPQPPFSMTVRESISGLLQIGARGGNGQHGGDGGAGGAGGNGSVQGDGGNGGKGGRGGDGGNNAPVQVIYNSLDGKIETMALKALPGNYGKGGKGGIGNLNGNEGDEGEIGKPGIPSEITVIRR